MMGKCVLEADMIFLFRSIWCCIVVNGYKIGIRLHVCSETEYLYSRWEWKDNRKWHNNIICKCVRVCGWALPSTGVAVLAEVCAWLTGGQLQQFVPLSLPFLLSVHQPRLQRERDFWFTTSHNITCNISSWYYWRCSIYIHHTCQNHLSLYHKWILYTY